MTMRASVRMVIYIYIMCISCDIIVSVLETVDRGRDSSATIHEALG